MTLTVHRRHAPAAEPLTPAAARIYAVQRFGAIAVGVVLLCFGTLGAVRRLAFLDTHGERLLGMSSNGLLSVLSLVVGVVLIGAALAGPRVASTVMVVFGVLFLLSALGNLAVLRTGWNLLAFRMSNVVFSIVVGLLLLTLGAYGRVTGNLPLDSPYTHRHRGEVEPSELPATPEEAAADAAIRRAEIAVVEHRATGDQTVRVLAMAAAHTRAERRRVWMSFDD